MVLAISTIVLELRKGKKPFVVALFLCVGLLLAELPVFRAGASGRTGILGGPDDGGISAPPEVMIGGVISSPAPISGIPRGIEEIGVFAPGAVTPPLVGFLSEQGALHRYTVREGDTLTRIANEFGISVQTLIGSNPEAKSRALQIGQELSVPPVSGALYHTESGDTPESIAEQFGISTRVLRDFNHSVNFQSFGEGLTIIIPGADPLSVQQAGSDTASTANMQGYFQKPTEGFNWGRLHPENAVDIAASCGTHITASAEGLVIDQSISDWSHGYGRYLIIEHPNGTKTRYAHLAELHASVGDYVKQGNKIGTMGETGEATGCHLHFEVFGAKNPFAK